MPVKHPLQKAIEDGGFEPRSYSGRAMYGCRGRKRAGVGHHMRYLLAIGRGDRARARSRLKDGSWRAS